MKDIDTKILEETYTKIYENINTKQGSVKITKYASNTDSSVTHYISYSPENSTLIDMSLRGNNLIERKEIDVSDIELYKSWYTKEVYAMILQAIR